MGVLDILKNGAKSFLSPPKRYPGNEYPKYEDVNKNQIADIIEVKEKKPAFIKKDHSRDKHGNYVPTITYPLPPVSWEKKQFDDNHKRRNSRNKYL